MNITGNMVSTVDALLERMDAAMDFLFFPKDKSAPATDIEVNGVLLPKLVAEQLRMQGVALSNYSPSELMAAVRACAFDSKLIDDDHGANFLDKLELTDHEQRQQDGGISFREKILKEREAKCHAAEEATAPHLPGCCT